MKVKELASNLGLKILTGETGLEKEVKGAYTCDLLSWVMSHAEKRNAWITVHTHINIVAVALLAEIACIIVPAEIIVEEATLQKAKEEAIPILSSTMSAFEISWKAHEIGIE